MNLNNVGIRRRLVISFSGIIAMLAIIGVVAITNLISINDNLAHIFKINLPAIDYIIEADRDLQQLLVAERSMIFTSVKSDQFQELIDAYEKNLAQAEERVGKYALLASSDHEQKILETYYSAREEWAKLSRQVVDGRMEDSRQGRTLALDLTLGIANEKFEEMRNYLDELTGYNLDEAAKQERNAKRSFVLAITVFLILLIVSVIGGVALSVLISNSITKPLKSVIDVSEKIAEGVLPDELIQVKGNDELATLGTVFNKIVSYLKEKGHELEQIAVGDLTVEVNHLSESDQFANTFDKMLVALNDSLMQVRASTEQVSVGADQISQTSQSLADGASVQASTLEEISAALNEISGQAEENTTHSENARTKAEESRKVALAGNEHIEKVVQAMDEINASADSIKSIVKSIDDIAFQTNLLALNAAVEAARAGQHGKGFAVVADEVRNLAHRSAESAKTTTDKVEEAIRSIGEGNRLVGESAEQFKKILTGTGEIATLMGDIASASNDQANSLKETKVSLVQIDEVTQNNAASAEENASTSEELMSQSETLKAMVGRFRLHGVKNGESNLNIDHVELPDYSQGAAGGFPVNNEYGEY